MWDYLFDPNPNKLIIEPELLLVDVVEYDTHSPLGDLIHISQHLPIAITGGNVVSIALVEHDLVDHLEDRRRQAVIERHADWLVEGPDEVLVDARVERLKREPMARHSLTGDMISKPGETCVLNQYFTFHKREKCDTT